MKEKEAGLTALDFGEFLQNNPKNTGSSNFRSDALDFAHPVDAGIIRILDNPMVNKAFAQLVDLSVDAQYGMILSTGIRVDDKQTPLSTIVRHCADILNIPLPYTIISSSITGLNAMTVGTNSMVYIAVSSLMAKMFSEDELKFVVGHESGHIALGHVLYHTVVSTGGSLSQLIPIIGPAVYQMVSLPLNAWSRRSEISADRAGLLCCENVDTAIRALLRLEAGFVSLEDIDAEEYIQNTQKWLKHSQIGYLGELMQKHPLLAKRMDALQLFVSSEKYYRLSGQSPPKDAELLPDEELDRRTEQIVKVIS